MARVVAFLPRLVALTVVWLLATAALTFAAGQKLSSATPTQTQTTTTTAAAPTVLVVPDVRRQAYVFAKGILQDAGFAWKVSGKIEGYAANTVVDQLPAPGARVVDTGAPTITLQLAKGSYPQEGAPENASPYTGTVVRSADQASAPVPAAPTRKTAAAKPVKKAAKKAAPAKKQPQKRTPAFTFPGAKPEPLDEPPLATRARDLQAWLAEHPKPSDANVKHWLYQHAWIVAGARQGWWHGAEALRILIQVDRRAQALWGIGAKSQAVARTALAEVEARSS